MRTSDTAIDSQQRIYKSAALLFSQKGYAGTSIRDIAAAVKLSVSTINYHVGSKEALYHEILRRTYEMEYKLFAPMLQEVDDSVVKDLNALQDLFKQFIDIFLKRIVDEPETYRLWTHHFLEETNILQEMNREFSLPFYQMVLNLLKRAREAGTISMEDADQKIFVTSVAWLLHGYFNGRKNNWGDPDYNPYLPSNLEGFQRYLYSYIDRMTDCFR